MYFTDSAIYRFVWVSSTVSPSKGMVTRRRLNRGRVAGGQAGLHRRGSPKTPPIHQPAKRHHLAPGRREVVDVSAPSQTHQRNL